jgi:2-polyprenyl-3-methyl-5-hydroxy-6-metoxy-1,4-benzoquinol methylase
VNEWSSRARRAALWERTDPRFDHRGDRSGTQVKPGSHVLDVGCGLGSSARYLAAAHQCQVTGIDLTQEYVDVANALARMVGSSDKAEFRLSATYGNAASSCTRRARRSSRTVAVAPGTATAGGA